GGLAGGVAHEFNNLLTAILGYTELALAQIEPGHAARGLLGEAVTGTHRAAELTRQLLAYAGRGRVLVQPVRLDEVVRSVDQLLKVSLSRKCTIQYRLEGLPPVEADAAQLRQLILNLAVNASEAIGAGTGVVTLRAGACACDAAYLAGCLGAG